jgi:hypothetical protein
MPRIGLGLVFGLGRKARVALAHLVIGNQRRDATLAQRSEVVF